MDCSYCRRYGDGKLYNPEGPDIYRGHELCHECYNSWQKSENKDSCPICHYETIRHLGKNLGKDWMITMILDFKKNYNLKLEKKE